MARAKSNFLISLLLLISTGELVVGQNCGCADIVSQQFFNGLTSQVDAGCEAYGFYTREAFLNAWQIYSSFEDGPTIDDSKREIAAFFAPVFHETINMCYKEQGDKSDAYCDFNAQDYPCTPGKMYYGRGPLQISWNYNYGPAGQEIDFDGLNWPEAVSTDPTISFKTALWFWMRNVYGIVGQGFGATIQAINGVLECRGQNQGAVNHLIDLYQNYCGQFNVSPGEITCIARRIIR